MKPVKIESDEAKVYAALTRIRDGRKVSVSFTQLPLSTVCTMSGRWVPQEPPVRVGWMVLGANKSRAIIMPTDKITLFSVRGRIHLRVDLAGRRLPRSAAMVRRARIAGILNDRPAAEGGAS